MIIGIITLFAIVALIGAMIYLTVVYLQISNDIKTMNAKNTTTLKVDNKISGLIGKVPTLKAKVEPENNDTNNSKENYYCCQNEKYPDSFMRTCDECDPGFKKVDVALCKKNMMMSNKPMNCNGITSISSPLKDSLVEIPVKKAPMGPPKLSCCQNIGNPKWFLRTCHPDGCAMSNGKCYGASKDNCDTKSCFWDESKSLCSAFKPANISSCEEYYGEKNYKCSLD
jgi:hypothetical protein